MKAAVLQGRKVSEVAQDAGVDIGTVAKHEELYLELRERTQDEFDSANTERRRAAVEEAETVVEILVASGTTPSLRAASDLTGTKWYPSQLRAQSLMMLRVKLGEPHNRVARNQVAEVVVAGSCCSRGDNCNGESGTWRSPKRTRRVVRPADHVAIKSALKAAIETGDSVTLVAERLRVDIATLAQHADLYNEVRKATRNRKAASDTARQDAAIAKAEAAALKLLRDGRRLTPRNAKGEGAYFYPSTVEWAVLALIRIGLGDRSVRHPASAARMSEAFLCKIEAAARRVRAAFGETQEKLQLGYQ